MKIDESTKIMARFHTDLNNRGLNIYNPYFEESKTNALYVLFHNKDPKPLFEGLRSLNISGAIPAGFEKDPILLDLVDELGPVSKATDRIGVVRQREGKVTGFYQAGYGLVQSIQTKFDMNEKSIVILGAGNVVRAFLTQLKLDGIKPKSIEIYNRTIKNAEKIAEDNIVVDKTGGMNEMESAEGNIFINATYIGSPWLQGQNYEFKEKFIRKFDYVADVTFLPLEPQLIEVANKLNIPNSPGHRMFLYQGKMCLQKVLDLDVDLDILNKKMLSDFKENWS
ncbi:MAG: hypothetical protein ABIE03_02175 [Patescibacteria group bacterium]|nr:hypothetical protein [Patescibacteria group bacterium]